MVSALLLNALDIVFNPLDKLIGCACSVGLFDLETIPVSGVMAGGNDYTGSCSSCCSGMTYHRSRTIRLADGNFNAISGHDFSYRPGKILGAKASIITYHDPCRWIFVHDIISGCLGA